MSEQHNLRRMIASLLVLSLLLPTGSITTGFVLGTAAAATTSTSQVYTLTFQGYDYNNKGEVSVLVNNQVVATLPPSYTRQNAKVFISVSLDISRYVLSGANTVTFRQNLYSSGVRNVQVTGPTGVLLSDSTYHELWTGGTSSVSYSFSVSQATTTSTTTTTTSTTLTTTTTITSTPPPGSSTYTLSFQGYDFDNQREVTVLVNNQVVAALPAADSSQNNNAFASFSLDISRYVIQGANTITFKQNLYSSAVQNVQVTRSSGAVLLSDSTNRGLWTGGTATTSYSFNVLVAATTTTSSSSTTTTTILPIPVSTTTTQTTTATSTTTTISQSGGPITYAVDIVNGQLVDASGRKFIMVGLNYGDIPENFVSGSYATDAQNMKNAGFNTVKLVKEWGSLENSANPSVFTYDNTAVQNMMAQISALTQNGINVVVKIHADAAVSSDAQHLRSFLGSQYCASSSYDSGFSTNFYTTSYLADSTTGHAHLTKLLLKISQLTRDNPRVIGFDVMNEPNYCSYTSSSVSSSIRTGWHQRITEIAQVLRNDGDNRIIFAEEAPFFEYYSNFVSFNDPRIVSSAHWYRAEYKTSSSSGTWAACWADMPTLQGYWGNTGRSGSSCSSVPIQVAQAQQKYPNQLFEVGEFGNIYRNTAGDLSDQWIKNSIALFQAQNVVGIFYWSSEETGTWVKDLASIAPTTTTPPTPIATTTTTSTTITTTTTSAQGTSQSFTLAFQGYDYDNMGEVSVLVNNQVAATLPTVDSPQNNNLYTSITLDVSKYVVSGTNTLTFQQNFYSSGIRNVQITGSSGAVYSNSTAYSLSDLGVKSVTYKFNTGTIGTTTTTTTTTATSTAFSGGKAFDYIVVIVDENHSLKDIIPSATYMTSLANTYGLATQYTAVASPSMPNYLGMFSGQTWGCDGYSGGPNSNTCTSNAWKSTNANLVDLLEAKGLTWKAYMENMPSNCYTSDSGSYYVRHNPFVYFSDIVNNQARCNRVVPAGSGASVLVSDLGSTSTASNFMWLTPNGCNGMHDCSVSTGDNYLSILVPQILNSNIFKTQRAALFVTTEEPSSNGGSQLYTVWAGPVVKQAYKSSISYNHYSFLKTIEANWGLSSLTSNDGGASPMSDFFGAVTLMNTNITSYQPSSPITATVALNTNNSTPSVQTYSQNNAAYANSNAGNPTYVTPVKPVSYMST